MREDELKRILLRALQTSLALGAACGGGAPPGGARDAALDQGASAGDAKASHLEASAYADGAAPDAGDPCRPEGLAQRVSCVSALVPATCFDASLESTDAAACATWCNAAGFNVTCAVEHTDAGSLVCYAAACTNGRRPAGLARQSSRGPVLGRYFADVARAEAASIDAFAILENDLAALGAPTRLLRAAARARADEVRHARLTATLARRHGGHPTRPHVPRRGPHPIEKVATENAVEGCVRETFGAVVAMHQAARASLPRVRAVMASIADDEVRHAALGWAFAAWADTQLSQAARVRIRKARREAVRSLRGELEQAVPPDLVRMAGVPPRVTALCMLDTLSDALWSSATPR